MRENKFKVFDKITNEIYQVSELELEGTHHYCYNEELEYLHVITDNCILMQYTGLKDKNDVEIYEGDVVKTKNSRYKVIFDKCCFWGVDELGKYPIYQIFHYVLDDEKFEVIGNIYENKELLDEH